MMKYELLNGNNLAYIGDAYYELYIRKYLLDKGITKSNDLRKASVKYVSASAHLAIVGKIFEALTEKEKEIFKRGRNNSSVLKSKSAKTYSHQQSSGFEAVIGYLYLMNQESRLFELLNKAIMIINEGESNE
jgi:ribonuclease-3 family protein